MPDPEVKAFELKVGDLYEAWRKKQKKLTLDLPKLKLEIDKLDGQPEGKTPEGKKQLNLLKVDFDKCCKQLESNAKKLETDLMKLDVPKSDPKGVEIPKSIKKVLKGEIAPGVYLTPDVKLDLKKFKIKKAGFKLKFEF